MPVLLAFTTSDRAAHTVTSVAASLARALHLAVEQRPMPSGTVVLRDLDEPAVRLAVLPYSAGHAARLVTDVIQRCTKPVVVVPVRRRATPPTSIDRVLVPLDGTVESAVTVAETVALFGASGADIIVLHVFDRTTVPKFWDQAVHARKSWVDEFLSRFCDQPNVRMELRSGTPGEHILDVTASEHADLIAFGWGQNLSAGRARTVRSTLAQSTIPVLLLPLADASRGGSTWITAIVDTAPEP
jgi:nucleotide-binding universal stress UspA family protein